MDHLLIVPLNAGISETFLASLRQAGWRVTVTADMVRAKQLLQKGDVSGVIMEFSPAVHDPDRFKVLRFVHEFCPSTLVIMLQSGPEAFTMPGTRLIQNLNTMEDARTEAPAAAGAALNLSHLSPAQRRIAELVAQAYPNREIARKLKIKEQSVRNELSRIFKKMGVWNRVELALLMRNGTRPANTTSAPAGGERIPQTWPAELTPPADGAVTGTRTSATM